jgi:transcriptional regulator with XRE-family HTH domain
VNGTTRTARNVTVTTNWRRNAVGNAGSRAQRLCDRREDSRLEAEEENGARRARATFRAVAGVALELERRRLFPTLPTLLRIALVFSVALDYFFAGAREKPLVAVIRKAERVQLPERQDGKEMSYRFESLDYPATERRFNSYCAEFFPVARDNVRLHTHVGVEFMNRSRAG